MSEAKHTARGPVYMFAPKELAQRLEREAIEAKLNRLMELEEDIAAHQPAKQAGEIAAQ